MCSLKNLLKGTKLAVTERCSVPTSLLLVIILTHRICKYLGRWTRIFLAGTTDRLGALSDVGVVCGLGEAKDGVGGIAGPGQAQEGGTLKSFSPDPEKKTTL